MSARELMHAWAHQTRPERKAGNVKFIGPALYSYATIIGRIYTRKGSARLVLLSEERYSVTTAKHLNYARSAVSHMTVLTVPHVTGARYHDAPLTREQHRANFDFLVKQAARLLKEAQRVQRTSSVEWRVTQAHHYLRHAGVYSTFFGLRWKAPAFPVDAWAAAQARAERIENPDPASADKRERERAERAERAREKAKRAAEVAALHGMALRTSWRLGFPWGNAGFHVSNAGPVMLRINGDTIETSLGARVPVAAAPMVWNAVQRQVERGQNRDFTANRSLGKTRIGDYPLDRIDADGTLHAGCHTIPYSELRAMARQLGLIERGQQ